MHKETSAPSIPRQREGGQGQRHKLVANGEKWRLQKKGQECVLGLCDQRVFTCLSARSGGVVAPQGERAGMAAEVVSLRQLG